MAFDRETLSPLYRLEIGEAGESCALYIAKRLGLPEHMLAVANEAAYGTYIENIEKNPSNLPARAKKISTAGVPRIKDSGKKQEKILKRDSFQIGDSVFVYPKKEIGIIFATANEMGEVGVQIKGKKQLVSYKRLKINVPASQLYPENYDFSIIFDSVETRKARHDMARKYSSDVVVVTKNEKLTYKGE